MSPTKRKRTAKPRSARSEPETLAVFKTRRDPADQAQRAADQFLLWWWQTKYPTWQAGLQALARGLRGLRENDWIERLPRQRGKTVRYRLTDEGREALTDLIQITDKEC